MFPYQTRCYTKTDKSITVNIIQRSCASPVNKKKLRSLGTNTLPYCFTYLPEFLEADYNFYQRQWKLEWIRLFNSLFLRISPSGWESASNRLHVTTDRLLKSAADMQKLHWRICNRSHTAGAEITLYTLFETAGAHWSKELSLNYSQKCFQTKQETRQILKWHMVF